MARLFTIKDNDSKRSVMTALWEFVSEAIHSGGLDITVAQESKKRAQEARYHAMIGDIFKQVEFKDDMGSVIKSDREWLKAVLIDDFGQEMLASGTPLAKPGRTTMSLDRMRIIQIRPSSSEFSIKEAAAFIEYLLAFGAQESVAWSDPESKAADKHYMEMERNK